jgi:hypothetical protein
VVGVVVSRGGLCRCWPAACPAADCIKDNVSAAAAHGRGAQAKGLIIRVRGVLGLEQLLLDLLFERRTRSHRDC